MSGQPTRNPTDASKFRQAYLANLALQAQIDDMNLQANTIYKKTGQTPSQPLDTRTTAEKLADVERLKIDVRSGLSQIADGTNASAIAEQLDPQQLTFLAQHMEEIIKDIKPKYKYGVEASIFVPYLTNYMTRAQQTNEVNYGLQQAAGANILLSQNQIMRDMVSRDNLQRLKMSLENSNLRNNLMLRETVRNVDTLQNILKDITEDMVTLSVITDANTQRTIQEEINNALQNVPTNEQIRRMLNELNIAQRNSNPASTENAVQEINGLISPNVTPALLGQIQQIHQEILQTPPQRQGTNLAADVNAEPLAIQMPRTNEEKKAYIREILQQRGVPVGEYNAEIQRILGGGKYLANLYKHELETVIRALQGQQGGNGIAGRIKGKGLKLPKKVSKNADYSQGIMPQKKYVPLGRYFIDYRRLGDNIIALKRGNGVNVAGFPVIRTSKEVGDVLRTIVGGGQPHYNQLEKLSPDEKQYIHKLAKYSNIIDRINIPTPNKTDDEKDVHEFEVAKGEILNGNDSHELVKKFKLMIMKLMNKGLLPRNQAKELLMDLASLGY